MTDIVNLVVGIITAAPEEDRKRLVSAVTSIVGTTPTADRPNLPDSDDEIGAWLDHLAGEYGDVAVSRFARVLGGRFGSAATREWADDAVLRVVESSGRPASKMVELFGYSPENPCALSRPLSRARELRAARDVSPSAGSAAA